MSTPGTTATQGTTYTYQIEVDANLGAVVFALVTAPSGATLSGNTITWTPSAAQSRMPNRFSVTATNAGGSVMQSWSVTPAGTVSGTWVDTYWTSSGPVQVPFDWTRVAPFPRALVPQADGSFQTIQGSGNADGTFTIPSIPGGYYWLQNGGTSYWTSSSIFDFGASFASLNPPLGFSTGNVVTTTINFNFAGLDPLQTGDKVAFLGPYLSMAISADSPAGATSFSTGAVVSSNFDFSQPSTALALQYEPEVLGPLNALRLGPEVTLPGFSLNRGTTNTVNATLSPSPQASFDLSVKGSAWLPLFSNAGPSLLSLQGMDLEVTAQPYATGTGNISTTSGLGIPLLFDPRTSSFMGSGSYLPIFAPLTPVCTISGPVVPGSASILPGEPPLTTDQDFGLVRYEDPFPSAWPRVFTLCQTATVPVPIPGFSSPVSFRLVDTQSSSIPTMQISPLIAQVQNPTINGASLFVTGTTAATGIILNWTAPSGTIPTGYKIAAYTLSALPNGTGTSISSAFFYTAKTSALLPSLQAGQTYVFIVTALLDGAANFETQPNRSALPTASVSIVSAPITTNSSP